MTCKCLVIFFEKLHVNNICYPKQKNRYLIGAAILMKGDSRRSNIAVFRLQTVALNLLGLPCFVSQTVMKNRSFEVASPPFPLSISNVPPTTPFICSRVKSNVSEENFVIFANTSRSSQSTTDEVFGQSSCSTSESKSGGIGTSTKSSS